VRVLVVNAGSSSLKLRLVGGDDEVLARQDLGPEDAPGDALRELGARADAVGHRVVHGGPRLTAPARIDERVLAELHGAARLAPLHAPPALAAIAAAARALPRLPAVACLDTAFHATLPPAAATYALPAAWRAAHGLRRVGFHGLSHAWVARTVRAPRVVSCHLGAGASLCAIRDGRSVDTTMGFTPLEGLVMATRSGSVDPGLVLWLLGEGGLGRDEVEEGLERRSGLLGLAGEADMRALLDRADEAAALALDVYVHRLRAGIAAMAAALGGLDALVFTGGVGERAAAVRARAAEGLGFLGVAIDAGANARAEPDADVGAPGAAARTLVVASREDLEIAREVRATLGPG
jgi:acetate kinase